MVGSIDPNPIVAGKGLRILEENGVEVVYDVMRAECDAINRHFFHYITTGMGVRMFFLDGHATSPRLFLYCIGLCQPSDFLMRVSL